MSRAIDHFKVGHQRLENYIASVTELLANVELNAGTLCTQSDEFVCRSSMEKWGLPIGTFSYSESVYLALPRNYAQVMLTEQSAAHDMWSRGETSVFVTDLVGVLRSRHLLKPFNFAEDLYTCERGNAVRYDALVPIGGHSFL